jgi:hypothetical protein
MAEASAMEKSRRRIDDASVTDCPWPRRDDGADDDDDDDAVRTPKA